MEEEDCEITTEYVDPSLLMGPEQLDDLCRLCANTDSQLMPIFSGEGLEHKIQNKIEEHLPIIAVTEFDRLPLSICYHCASSLIAWHNLYEGCKIADSRLRKLLGEDIKLEDEDTQYEETYEAYNLEDGEEEEEEEELEEDEENIEQHNLLDNIMQLSPTTGTLRPADIEYNNSVVDDAIQEALNTSELIETEGDVVINTEECIIDSEGIEVRSLTEEEDFLVEEIIKEEMIKKEIVKELTKEEDMIREEMIEEEMVVKEDEEILVKLESEYEEEDEYFETEEIEELGVVVDEEENNPISCCEEDNANNTADDGPETSEEKSTTPTKSNTTCDICGRTFRSTYNLAKHKQVHASNVVEQQPRYICRLCDKFFSHEYSILSHLKLMHEVTHDFAAYTDQQYREKKHRARYYCDTCGKPFLSRFNLNQHYITHTGKKDVVCEVCNYRCYTKSQLEVHKVKHNKRFCCEICSKMFVYRFQLETHLQSVHYNLRPFKCDICNKMFKTKYNLGSHKAMHRNVRNFPCHKCAHKCRTSYDLKIHVRTHTREKPYECAYCCRGFNQKGDRAKHEKLHEKYRNQHRKQEDLQRQQLQSLTAAAYQQHQQHQQQREITTSSSSVTTPLEVYLTADDGTGATVLVDNIVHHTEDIALSHSIPL